MLPYLQDYFNKNEPEDSCKLELLKIAIHNLTRRCHAFRALPRAYTAIYIFVQFTDAVLLIHMADFLPFFPMSFLSSASLSHIRHDVIISGPLYNIGWIIQCSSTLLPILSMAAQLPTTTRSYHFPALGSYNNLTLQATPLPAIKSTFVLVKIHAVSLQYRDLMIAENRYSRDGISENLVPCSDMAGEVVSVGSDVTRWTVGDRVCANFSTDHLDGDVNAEIVKTALGKGQQGVLTEYRDFPDHVSIMFLFGSSDLYGVSVSGQNSRAFVLRRGRQRCLVLL